MRGKIVLRKLILAGMLALSGCGTSLTENSGILSLKVHWPEQPGQFSVAAIPPQTSLIVLEISGEGMGETLKSELKKSPDNSPASLKFTLPTGDKTLTARAFDRNQKLLALATSLVKIQAGQKHQALLDLQPVAPEKPQLAVPELGDAPKPQEPAPARSPASAPAPEARVPAPLRRLVEAVVEKVADKALPLARKQQEAKAGSTPTPAPTSTPSPTPVPSVTPTPAPTASPSILPVELPGDLPGGLGNRNKGNKK